MFKVKLNHALSMYSWDNPEEKVNEKNKFLDKYNSAEFEEIRDPKRLKLFYRKKQKPKKLVEL